MPVQSAQNLLLSIPDPVSGEIRYYKQSETGVLSETPDPLISAAKRWKYKYVVRDLLGYESRQAKCHRWRVPGFKIEVQRSLIHDQTFFTGLEICSSVFLCPLCAAKISERRAHELTQAIENAKKKGLWVVMLTLTVPHGLGDKLGSTIDPKTGKRPASIKQRDGILDRLIRAWSYHMTQGRKGKELKSDFGIVGSIRALEVTHGVNGWHPHFHILLFIRPNNMRSIDDMQPVFAMLWRESCLACDLPAPSFKYGCHLDNASRAAEYVSKWGPAYEMTKSHVKHGKTTGATPWDMLRIVSGETWENMPEYYSYEAASLWLDYAAAFKGRRQLVWSRGLSKLLEIDVKTDEEHAHEDLESAAVLYQITDQQWSWILAARAEVEILSISRDCPAALEDYINSLRTANYSSDRELVRLFGSDPLSCSGTPF